MCTRMSNEYVDAVSDVFIRNRLDDSNTEGFYGF